MKNDELWKDMLHDALPPGVNAAALEAMLNASRRRHSQRRAVRACSAALLLAAMAAASFWIMPVQQPMTTAVTSQQQAPLKNETHHLTDAELVARLTKANFGIIIASQDDSRRLLIVSQAGTVHSP